MRAEGGRGRGRRGPPPPATSAARALGSPPASRQWNARKSAPGQVAVEAQPLGHVARAGADREVVDRAAVDADRARSPAGESRAGRRAASSCRRRWGRSGRASRRARPRATRRRAPGSAGGRRSSRRSRRGSRGDDTRAAVRRPTAGCREYGLFFARFHSAGFERRMIEVQNLSKRYPTRLAVDDVTFSVREGRDRRASSGPTAPGKTTTMRVLTGFLPPTRDAARVAGTRRRDAVERGARRARLPAGVRGHLPRDARRASTSSFRARLEGVPGGPCAARVAEALDQLPARRGRRPEDREPLQGLPAAHGARRRARPPAARPDPRRADDRARPGADHQDPRDDPRARPRIAPSCSRRTSCPRSRRSATAS